MSTSSDEGDDEEGDMMADESTSTKSGRPRGPHPSGHDFDKYDATLYPLSRQEATEGGRTGSRSTRVFDPFLDDPADWKDASDGDEDEDEDGASEQFEDAVETPAASATEQPRSVKIMATREEAQEAVKQCQSDRQVANRLFAQADFDAAKSAYRECLQSLPKPHEIQDPDEALRTLLRTESSILWANCAACSLKRRPVLAKEAVEECTRALSTNERYVKALHRRIMANEILDSWSSLTQAKKDLETLKSIEDDPQIASLKTWLAQASSRIEPRLKTAQDKEQAEMIAKLKEMGNSVLGRFGLSTDMFKMQQNSNGGYSMSMGS